MSRPLLIALLSLFAFTAAADDNVFRFDPGDARGMSITATSEFTYEARGQ